MKKIFTTYAFLLISLFLSAQVTGPRVWPGDINNSGLVNEVDVLYWGVAFGAEGPARPFTDIAFIGYPIPDFWAQSFPSNGLNFLYADANGDGRVDELDLMAVDTSFGMQHIPFFPFDNFPVNPNSTPAPINVLTDVRDIDGGREIELIIEVGTESEPVDSFYGFSFRLFYDTLFARNGVEEFGLTENNWIEDNGQNASFYAKDHPDEGYLAVAITRTNQQIAQGFGQVFRGIIVVEDIIFSTRVDTFDIRIDSTRLISSRMQSYVTEPLAMQFNSIVTSTKRPVFGSNELKIFPNPTRDVLNIELQHPSDLIQNINLYNFVGQSVGKVTFSEGRASYRMSVAHLSRGMYTIVTESKRGLYSQKVFIH